jgi:hypothetical protein
LVKPCGGFSIPMMIARLSAISTNCAKLSIAWKPTRICSQTGSTGEHSTVNCGCWPKIVRCGDDLQDSSGAPRRRRPARDARRSHPCSAPDLKPETLGLTLAEGKMILKDPQQILVEGQVASFLLPKRPCPECGQPRYVKGHRSRAPERSFWS